MCVCAALFPSSVKAWAGAQQLKGGYLLGPQKPNVCFHGEAFCTTAASCWTVGMFNHDPIEMAMQFNREPPKNMVRVRESPSIF